MIKINSIYRLVSLLFISSIPLMPLYGMKIHYILGFLSIIFLLIQTVFVKKAIDKLIYFEIIYIVFICYSWFNSSNAPSIVDSKYLVKNMAFNFCSIVTSFRLLMMSRKEHENIIIKVLEVFSYSTLIISIYCIIVEYILMPGTGQRLGHIVFANQYGTRMTYTFNLFISSLYIIFQILNKNINKYKRSKYFFLLSFFLVCSLISGTRKLLLGLVIFLIVYMILDRRINIYNFLVYIILGIISIVGLYVSIMKIDILYNTFGNRIETLFQQMTQGSGDGSLWERNLMIDYAIKYFKINPLTGNGTDAFRFKFANDTGIFLYSHNNFTEILCNLGIIGFFIYYGGLLLTIIKIQIKKIKETRYIDNYFIASIVSCIILDYWTVSYYRLHFLILYVSAAFWVNIRNSKYKLERQKINRKRGI